MSALADDAAYLPMPMALPADGDTPPHRIPISLFLPPTTGPGHPAPPIAAMPDWHGLPPVSVAHLIRRYTRIGDIVLDIDAHPTVAAAAVHLRRVPSPPDNAGTGSPTRPLPAVSAGGCLDEVMPRPEAVVDLIMVAFPRPWQDPLDLIATVEAMQAWRRLLRPGGHLIVVLDALAPEPDSIGYRSSVIAAARAAGLLYHQHIPVVHTPLPEHEPRTDIDPATEPTPAKRLPTGRHRLIHRDLIVFAGTATAQESIDA
ncbi:hypothetical protein Val02_66360 [Virgisporangium aliadipatigenens]|uniref:Uncharacterized protein n=1 Tax=Virgisporangium aliadipatigenens TaxID=741659 RepID=A0A8J4DSZ0_9ACTN|nr:hypothetical protein [Virgisporangium aliadipatigenens]GIJ49750.1 hypothetical protein Val02_66360 [Virgisporangium aliadipatigenens]